MFHTPFRLHFRLHFHFYSILLQSSETEKWYSDQRVGSGFLANDIIPLFSTVLDQQM